MRTVEKIKHLYPESTFAVHSLPGGFSDNLLVGGIQYKPKDLKDCIDTDPAYYVAHLLVEGTGSYYDDQVKKVPLKQGSFFQRIPGRRHTIEVDSDGKWLEIYFGFPKELSEPLQQAALLPQKPVLFLGEQESHFIDFLTAFRTLEQATPQTLPVVFSGILKVLASAGMQQAQAEHGKTAVTISVCQYINQHITTHLTSQAISEALSMPYEKLRKIFYRDMGQSITSYLVEQRINYAKMLLVHTQLSMEQIAETLSYCDCAAFHHQFKMKTGMAPAKYRALSK